MSPEAVAILDHLQSVAAERAIRAANAVHARRVLALKAFQHRRFERTYADLLADPGTGDAARFFLSDLYGVQDFTDRDTQFGRIVPSIDRVFPDEVVRTVLHLAELHAVSERMDAEMARTFAGEALDARGYADAWCHVGQPEVRERQIVLMSLVGGALVHYTRNAWIRRTLRLMRGPARLAGLQALHGFLERGYETFGAMRDPQRFLDTVAERERRLAAQLFKRSATLPPDLPPA